jgi:hypothetical protein
MQTAKPSASQPAAQDARSAATKADGATQAGAGQSLSYYIAQ